MREFIATAATLAFLVAVVGIFRPFIKGWHRKHFAFAAVGLFVLIGVSVPPTTNRTASERITSQPSSSDSDTPASDAPASEDASIPSAEQQYRDQLTREIAALRQNPTMGDISEDRSGVFLGVTLIGARAELLARAPDDVRPETRQLETEYRSLQETFQRDLGNYILDVETHDSPRCISTGRR